MVGLGATGSAVADRLIGSKAIKNNSVKSIGIRNGTLAMRDLRPGLADKIRQPGPAGRNTGPVSRRQRAHPRER